MENIATQLSATQATAKAPELTELCNAADNIASIASSIEDRISQFLIRVKGEAPPPKEASSDSEVPSGTIPYLRAKLQIIDSIMHEIDVHTKELESIG